MNLRVGRAAILWPLAWSFLVARARAEPTAPSSVSAAGETEIVVRALPRAGGTTDAELTGGAASEGAGTQGDAVKALDTQPGVGRGAPGDFVAWGSTPAESKYYVDGVEIPRLYHGSGVRSVLPSSRVGSLSLSPGAFGAEDGGAVGGLVRLRTLEPDPTTARLFASADFLDAAALASAPMMEGHAAVLGAARYGYAERWLSRVLDDGARTLYVVPRYWDAQLDSSWALRAGESLRVAALASSDVNDVSVGADDPSRTQTDRMTARFGRVHAIYRKIAAGGAEGRLTPFVGWDTDDHALSFGARTARLDVSALRYGLRSEYRSRLASTLVLTVGFDATGTSAHVERDGSAAVPRREGDPYPFGTPPGTDVAVDRYDARVLSMAPFVKVRAELGPLVVEPGFRLEGVLIETTRNRPSVGGAPDVGQATLVGSPDPRLSAELRLSSRASLVLAAGRYHQAPDPKDLGAVFGNPAVGPSSATHIAFGERARLFERTWVEVLAFAKWLADLPARSPDPTPALSRALVGNGEGRAYGVQFLVRQREIAGFSGYLSATVSRSERTDPGKAQRLSDYDAPVVAALVVQKRMGPYRVGLRGRYATGLPRTAVVGAYYDVAGDRWTPELGGTNTTRLPNFVQLDVRLDRRFELGGERVLTVYVDALNVTGSRNAEEFSYSADYARRGTVSGLPTMAVAGVSVEM